MGLSPLTDETGRASRIVMKNPFRLASIASALLGLVMLGLGISMLLVPTGAPFRPLRLVESIKSFGLLSSRQSLSMSFTVANDSNERFQIIGSSKVCSLQGCAYVLDEDLPVGLPPGSTQDVKVNVTTSRPGIFDVKISLFTTGPGQFEIPLNIRGTVGSKLQDVSSAISPKSSSKIETVN